MSAEYSKKCLASERLGIQILGALIKWWWLTLPLLIALASLLYGSVATKNQWCQFAVLLIALWLTISVCSTLTDVFSLRKKETGITWCQIAILLAIGGFIVGILIIFNITGKAINTVAFGISGSLLAWIFQDPIRGATAFIHLRLNHLLQIDDWIEVPKYGVDGKVTHVTLTTVTIYNWDTTTSAIPTCVLLADHFINMQKMADGKTYGRRTTLSFIIDTSSFHALSQKDVDRLKTNTRITRYLPQEEIHEDMTNAQLYRQYLFHWLMNNKHVSQHPCLMVNWQKHTEDGMTLQLYGYITDSDMVAFEWQQSLITEHVIESVKWFDLSLYQRPSSLNTIYISDQPVSKRAEN